MFEFSRFATPFVLGVSLSFAATAEPVKFVALGDIPYGRDQEKTLAFISRKIGEAGVPFVVHYGDVKAGDSSCDLLDEKRRDLIYGILPGRVIYTPGDNDWTDCDRKDAGEFNELKMLKKLRRLFFSADVPYDSELRIARQGATYPENARWEYGGLQFVTLHIVGTDNGRDEIDQSDVQEALDRVDARDQANLAWLDAAFLSAHNSNLKGLVAFMQADPYDIALPKQRNVLCTKLQRQRCNPYLSLLRRLTDQADKLDKPVLLVHGSTNPYCLDRGFGGWRAPKLWRLNGPGDFVVIDAAVVSFDPDDEVVPFKVRGLLTNEPPPGC